MSDHVLAALSGNKQSRDHADPKIVPPNQHPSGFQAKPQNLALFRIGQCQLRFQVDNLCRQLCDLNVRNPHRPNARSKPRTCRRSATASSVSAPCFHMPLASPFGAPDPLPPPCIRQTFLPFTAGEPHDLPCRVRAWQRGAVCIAHRCVGLSGSD